MKKFLTTLLLVACMLTASVACAEVKTYTGEGTYVMSEGENLGVSKERAKADAMRNAAEKAGTYVKSYSRTVNLEFDEDIIETMTANILKLVEAPHFFPLETVDNLEGVLIRVTVKVQIDDADIKNWLKKDSQEISTLVSQMEALKKSNDELARQNEELKKQLAAAKTEDDKERITQEFAAEDKKFLSNQKVDEGWKLWNQKDFNGAIKLFDEAIQLNPDNASARGGRGTAYNSLGQYERAIQDLDRAIQLDPNNAVAYNNRGNVYQNLGQYERAIQDYSKAIELAPNWDWPYNNRGLAYTNGLKQYERAISDYSKAIQVNPNFAEPYNNRAVTYERMGQYEKAISDYNKTVQLNPNHALAYSNRGVAYERIGQYEQAIQSYSKAIQLDPNFALAYNNRGYSYYLLKNYQQALKDFDKALEIDPNNTLAKNNRAACLKALGK